MKIARLITTFDCIRDCEFCVNKVPRIMDQGYCIKPEDLKTIGHYDMVLITGGEPMLDPERTLTIIKRLKAWNPAQKIYLYSSIPVQHNRVLDHLDGMTYTIHKESSPMDLATIQATLMLHPNRSYRLNIDPEYRQDLKIKPYLWEKIKIKIWYDFKMVNIPENETLFILEE
jgi:organic radical activating enzyme